MTGPEPIAFGADVFHHACGGELHRGEAPRPDGRDVFCEGCGARWSIAAWDQAQGHAQGQGGSIALALTAAAYGCCPTTSVALN